MPIAQIPPANQTTDPHQPKESAQRNGEDSFREVLDGAKKQIKPRQKEPNEPEPPATPDATEPSTVNEASTGIQAAAGEAAEPATSKPARRPKKTIDQAEASEGQDGVKPGHVGVAVTVTPALSLEAIGGTPAADDASTGEIPDETEITPEMELGTPTETMASIAETLPTLSRDFALTVKDAESELATNGGSPARPSVPALHAASGVEPSDQTTAHVSSVIANAPEQTDLEATRCAAPGRVEIATEEIVQHADGLQPPPLAAPAGLSRETVQAADPPAHESLSVTPQNPPAPPAERGGQEQAIADHDASTSIDGETPADRHTSALPASFSTASNDGDVAHTAGPATAAVAPRPEQPAAIKLVPPPTAPLADPIEARFADANHPRIITAMQSELMPSGGIVRLRLDPPELGALQVRIEVRDGVVAASFQTSNDEATRLLTRSLQQLKTTLESHGVTVEKLYVQQTPREQWDGSRGGGDDRRQSPQHWQQQEQQRREMLQRMWRRVRDGRDPFDLVA